MKWTKTPPSEAGWYWVNNVLPQFPQMAQVRPPDGVFPGVVRTMDGANRPWVNACGLIRDWSGPIPEPEEPADE